MPIVALLGTKGGTGKTTVAINLAAALSRKERVAVIDADTPQHTAESWHTLRQEERPTETLTLEVARNPDELIKATERATRGADWVLIDLPARVSGATAATLALADLCLVPLSPSAAEAWALDDLIRIVGQAGKITQAKLHILWNKYRGHLRGAEEFRKEFTKDIDLPQLRTRLGFRVAYQDSMAEGLSALEWKDRKAREELEALTKEVRKLVRA